MDESELTLNTAGLPPMPDRRTGEPRPPRAPLKGRTKSEPRGRLKDAPTPPDGEGQIVEWHCRSSMKYRVLGALIYGGLLAVFFTVKDGGLSWVDGWGAWAIIGVAALIGVALASTIRMSAGADWFINAGDFVKTYELTRLEVTDAFADHTLALLDKHGNKVRVSLSHFANNRELWDLVYNGIRHSVAAGADTNPLARTTLRLDDIGQP